ncbi:hypothetical protein Tco_0624653 [Tanacetum coccineum]|uniref:Uncharacterized protein n=1 Tax=Tanacetum coccineum TaxID=301880 RepID=A0ABQ4WEJ6_9ASTR
MTLWQSRTPPLVRRKQQEFQGKKGVEIRNIEDTERPKPTSTRLILTLRPLPKIDPKDKGKKRIEEEDEPDTKSKGITKAEKKFKQVANDEEVARKARINADKILAEELQKSAEEERQIKELNKDPEKKRLKKRVFNETPREEDTVKVPAEQEVTEQDSEIMETKSFIARLHKVSSPDRNYLVVYRVNGHFRAFNYLMEVLYIFDRQDLFHLYDLVMKQYSEITPKDIELILWGDFKIMMESSTEEIDQELKDGTVIYMLVERRYPLSKELLQQMIDLGLEVEEESNAALNWVLNSPCFIVKSWLVQDQTVPVQKQTAFGKDKSNPLIVDSLLKTIRLSIHLVVYNEELALPEQTATGKGISNPLMAGSFPKTTKPT